MSDRLELPGMLTLSGRAVHKLDRAGFRGASYVTYAEIEAVVATLAALGFPAIEDDRTIEDPCFVSSRFHPSNFMDLAEAARREIAPGDPRTLPDDSTPEWAQDRAAEMIGEAIYRLDIQRGATAVAAFLNSVSDFCVQTTPDKPHFLRAQLGQEET